MPVPSQENDGCPMSVVLWVKVLCLSFVLCFFFTFLFSFVFTFIVQTYETVIFVLESP
jgi:hypothetical protein